MNTLLYQSAVFSEVGSRLGERVFSSVLFFGIAILIVCVIGFLLYYFFIYKRKFDILIKIKSERAEEKTRIIFDKGAILYDRKDNAKFLRLWGLNVELPLPRYNVLQSTNKGDYIEIYRDSESRFYYILSKLDKKSIISADGKIIPMAEIEERLIDNDMEFWRAKRKKKNVDMFDPEKPWMKLLPYLPHILTGAIMIFILYIFMDTLPQVLSQLRELAQTLNNERTAQVVTGSTWVILKSKIV